MNYLTIGMCILAAHVSASAATSPLAPKLVGEWWTIATSPDLGELTTEKQQPVDFGIWQAADGKWQLWSCVRGTKEQGNTRLFHRWESADLRATNWTPMGIAMRADPSLGETRGGLQAPFVISNAAKYWMFYGDWVHICLATSTDNDQGGPQIIIPDAAMKTRNTRDPMVLAIGRKWYCYYTGHPDKTGVDYARTSEDLVHWSDERVVASGGSAGDGPYAAECPFVVEAEPGHFYLFRTQRYSKDAQTRVYHSTDPLDFGLNDDASHLVTMLPIAAPEVFKHDGKWYVAALLPTLKGIQVSELSWKRVNERP